MPAVPPTMDPTPLLVVANELRQCRNECGSVASDLSRLANRIRWQGPDRDGFLNEAMGTVHFIGRVGNTAEGGRREVQRAANTVASTRV
jgi:hypothetical protein